MAETLSAADLHVALGAKKSPAPILRGIDFTACAGQVVGLCGPNGAGKSTLLRTLAGFLPAHRGGVSWMGRPLPSIALQERAKMMAFLHQESSLAFDFTVREIVLMGRSPYRPALAAPSTADGEVARRAMEEAGCAELAEAPFSRLSGGERQRVMLARVLCQKPSIFLLDEPTASLDIQFAQSLYRLMERRAQAGATVVMVLHDLRAAARACTHLYLLREGRVVASGPPRLALTPEHLEAAYGVRTQVFENPAGEWDYYLLPCDSGVI